MTDCVCNSYRYCIMYLKSVILIDNYFGIRITTGPLLILITTGPLFAAVKTSLPVCTRTRWRIFEITSLRCDSIFNYDFIANLLPNLMVKECNLSVPFLLTEIISLIICVTLNSQPSCYFQWQLVFILLILSDLILSEISYQRVCCNQSEQSWLCCLVWLSKATVKSGSLHSALT